MMNEQEWLRRYQQRFVEQADLTTELAPATDQFSGVGQEDSKTPA